MKLKFCKPACFALSATLLAFVLSACNPGQTPNPPDANNGGRNIGFDMPNSSPNANNMNNPFRNNLNPDNMDANNANPNMNANNMNPGNMNTDNMNANNTNQITTQNPLAMPQNASDMRQKSTNISNQLNNMAEVDNANTIVTGNTCFVAYSPANGTNDVNATKDMIINKVKQIDPAITNVVVSESMDAMNQVNRLLSDMANNKPMDQINQEVTQLIQKATPVAS
jgi:spore cortex protein